MKKLVYVIALFGMLIGISACKNEHTHNIVSHEAKDPTCSGDGHNAYEECTECDYTTYEKIDALGHDLVHYELEEASCKEKGKKEHWYCHECETYFTDAEGTQQIAYEHLIIDQMEHLDENNDYLCDYGCGELLITKETLNKMIENTLSSTKATVNELYISASLTNSYYFDENLLYLIIDNYEEKYYYSENDTTYLLTKIDKWNREIINDEISYVISYIFKNKFDLEITGDIWSEVCSYGVFEGRRMFSYKNSLDITIDVVINDNNALLDGLYIHDENNNIIYTFEILYGENEEVANTWEDIKNQID